MPLTIIVAHHHQKVRDSSKAELTETDSEDDRADDEAEANARRASIAALRSLAYVIAAQLALLH